MTNRNPIMRFLNFLNYKMSFLGALIMGSMVLYINIDHGYFPAAIAATKQILYTFFIGGFLLKLLELQLKWHKDNFAGLSWSVVITTLLTTLLVYSVHSFRGTPEPLYSTLPTLFLAPIGFTTVALQKKHLRKSDEQLQVQGYSGKE